MSKITTYNYEAYLLDSMEGNLSTELAAELLLFFENNPELKEEDFELAMLKPVKKKYCEKETLKKGVINEKNYESFLIADTEKSIDEKTKKELRHYLKNNPKKQIELDLYNKTRLIAPTIVFKEKESLKRKERKVIPLYWWTSSAAAIILAMFLLGGVFENREIPELKIAETHTAEPKTQQTESFLENKQEPHLVVEIKNEIKASRPKPKKQQKQEETVAVIEKGLVAEIKDTIISTQEEKPPVLMADNVKITFEEDDLVVENTNTTPQKKKKKRLFKKIFNSQIRDKVREKVMRKEVNESGEVVAYALAVGNINLYRKEVK